MTEYDKELQTGTPEYEEAMRPQPEPVRAGGDAPGSDEDESPGE